MGGSLTAHECDSRGKCQVGSLQPENRSPWERVAVQGLVEATAAAPGHACTCKEQFSALLDLMPMLTPQYTCSPRELLAPVQSRALLFTKA